jgi:hypothetical protein
LAFTVCTVSVWLNEITLWPLWLRLTPFIVAAMVSVPKLTEWLWTRPWLIMPRHCWPAAVALGVATTLAPPWSPVSVILPVVIVGLLLCQAGIVSRVIDEERVVQERLGRRRTV